MKKAQDDLYIDDDHDDGECCKNAIDICCLTEWTEKRVCRSFIKGRVRNHWTFDKARIGEKK